MPVFGCYRGDCDNLAFEAAGRKVFRARDALGREWLCVDSGLSEIGSEFLPPAALEMMKAQALAHGQGLSGEGSEQLLLDCPDEAALRRHLVLTTYPPAAESQAR